MPVEDKGKKPVVDQTNTSTATWVKRTPEQTIVTTQGDDNTVVAQDPNTKIKQTGSWMLNPDGTPNKAALAEAQAMNEQAMRANGIDPNTGDVDRTYLSSLFPALRTENRKDEAKINRLKQIESGLYNSLAVLGDMVTTAAGGNVWKRDPNTTAKEAEARNRELENEQLNEDAAKARTRQKLLSDYAKAVNDINKHMQDKYNYTVETQNFGNKTTTTKHGETRKTVPGSISTTTVTYSGNGNGGRSGAYASAHSGGGSRKEPQLIKIPLKDNTSVDVRVPANQYEATGVYLSALYNALGKAEDSNIKTVLRNAGIKPNKDGSYESDKLLSSGIIFDNPQVREQFVNIINDDESISPDNKQRIIADMYLYSSTRDIEKKKSIWQRIKEFFTGGDDEPQAAATQQGAGRLNKNDRSATR